MAFDPGRRLDVNQALQHKYMAPFYQVRELPWVNPNPQPG